MDPILLEIWNFELHWYSALILIGFLVAYFVIKKEAKRLNVSKDFIFNLIFWTVVMGFIGARLYYVLFNWSTYASNPIEILKSWNGGLAIHGGIILGFITLVLYTKKYKAPTFKIADILVVGLLIAQTIGRWGNFFNGEAHGAMTTIEHLRDLHIPDWIIQGMNINGVYYHPTFLYESLLCLLGFILLLFIRRYKYLHVGQLTSLYCIYYGVVRIFIESMRTDSLMFAGFKAAQIVSGVMIVIGLIAFMILSRKGQFEDLYNEPAAEIKF